MSPILVRPVREQLEHDRIIRLLQAKTRRKYDAGHESRHRAERRRRNGANRGLSRPGAAFARSAAGSLQAIVEVETGESVNHLEALAQWAHFSKLRAAFHLYVPSEMVDVARRLCEDNQIHVNEIWSYHTVGDEVRFTLVHRSRDASAPARAASSSPAASARKKSAAKKPALKKPAAKKLAGNAGRPAASKAGGKPKPAAKSVRTAKGATSAKRK